MNPETLRTLMNRLVGASARGDADAVKDYAHDGDAAADAWEADIAARNWSAGERVRLQERLLEVERAAKELAWLVNNVPPDDLGEYTHIKRKKWCGKRDAALRRLVEEPKPCAPA